MQSKTITPPPGNKSPYDRQSAAITEAQAVIVALALLATIASLWGAA